MAKSILRAGKIAGVVIVAIIVVAAVLYSAGVLSIAQTDYPPPETTTLPESSPDEPVSDVTLDEQMELVTTCLAGDDLATAVAEMDKMLVDFAQDEQLPSAVRLIVRKAVKAGKYEDVCSIAGNLPGDKGIWTAMVFALAAVYEGEDAALDAAPDAAIEDLAVNYSGDLRSIEVFGQIAYGFRQQRNYARARQLYQHVIDTWPNGPRAVFSQRGLVLTNLALGDTAAESAALVKLLDDYGQDPEFAECVAGLIKICRKKKGLDSVIAIHQAIVDNRADCPLAIRSQYELFYIALVGLKDNTKATAAYNTLLDQFAGHAEIASVLSRRVALAYRKQKRYADSLRVYQYVIDTWPNGPRAAFSQRGLVLVNLDLGDMAAADAAMDELLTNYAQDPDFVKCAAHVARAYRNKKQFDTAIGIYKFIAEIRGDDKQLADQVYEMGEYYHKRKDYACARGVYQSVIADWPGTANAIWSQGELFYIALVDLKDNTKATAAYNTLLDQFAGHAEIASVLSRRVALAYRKQKRYADSLETAA